MKLLKLFVTALFAALMFAASCTQKPGADPARNGGADPTASESASPLKTPGPLEIGAAKYKEYCSKCHRDNGTGGKIVIKGHKLKPANLTKKSLVKEPDSEYIETMEEGIADEGMPSFKDELSKTEMHAVLKYVREKIQQP